MNRILGIILCGLFMSTVQANVFDYPEKLENIAPKIPQYGSLSCKFEQEKFLPKSDIMLKSSGDFKYEKDKGVTFYTIYPIRSTSSYTSREYKHINNVISAISNKSYSKLEKDFQFYYEDGWRLGLVPKKDSQVHKYLKSIEIEGNPDMITKIIISTVDSGKTSISFKKG